MDISQFGKWHVADAAEPLLAQLEQGHQGTVLQNPQYQSWE